MDGTIAKLVGNCGHIPLPFPDQLFCFLNPQPGIPLHDTIASLMLEELLGKRTAHRTVVADVCKTEIFSKVVLHERVCHLKTETPVFHLGGIEQGSIFLILGVLDDQLQKESLEIVLDQLLAPKWPIVT